MTHLESLRGIEGPYKCKIEKAVHYLHKVLSLVFKEGDEKLSETVLKNHKKILYNHTLQGAKTLQDLILAAFLDMDRDVSTDE